ncbi:MAG: hypothetical protein O9318_06715 [Hylemonella sp.]|uniref:hypothetical protein n=1 Tax=Hylemonella sp. TaxID=2066020 RepID=UPI0022BA7ACE|nr:hypothetical protein [Hylemonella sp.]MCZ8252143.1 hypothetical protein [Hylemonella sp.]
MDEREIAASGAAYKARVTNLYSFLVDEFGFEPPIDAGGQYRHALAYTHRGQNLALLVASAFHPVDYGFEITLYPADGPWHGDCADLIFHTLKEQQDRDLQFLDQGASALRATLAARLAAHGSYKPLPPSGAA